MTADEGRVEGCLEIRSHDYQLPNSMIRYWDYPAVEELTVRMSCEHLVLERHYDQYSMAAFGWGCRWWT